jgi:hypothetical protein
VKFRHSDDFFVIFCENSRVVGISTVSGISATLCIAVDACIIAVASLPAFECVPDVASISAAAGVPLVPDVLTVARFPAFVGVPGVVFSAVAVVLEVDGIFAAASFPADLASLYYCSCYLYVQYFTTLHIKAIIFYAIELSYIGSRPQSIGLSDIGLTKNYRLPTSACKKPIPRPAPAPFIDAYPRGSRMYPTPYIVHLHLTFFTLHP